MSNTLLNANAEARFLRHIENLVNGQPISEWDLECLLHTLINAAFSYKEQRLSVHTRTELLALQIFTSSFERPIFVCFPTTFERPVCFPFHRYDDRFA